MTTTPAGHFRDIVGEFIRKEFSEKDSEAYKVRSTLRSKSNSRVLKYL